MKLTFSSRAWKEYVYWQKTDKAKVKRSNALIKEPSLNPFEDMGKPGPLKHGLSGYWSRRINDEDRFVYKASDDGLLIAQLRYHYEY